MVCPLATVARRNDTAALHRPGERLEKQVHAARHRSCTAGAMLDRRMIVTFALVTTFAAAQLAAASVIAHLDTTPAAGPERR